MEHILNKIKKEQVGFSKSLRKTADFFYNDPKIFAVHSAAQVGKHVGVSETTIIRFAHKLGYSGYSEFQQDIQQRLFQKSSLTDYVEGKRSEEANSFLIKNLMQHDINNIRKLIDQIREADLKKAVHVLGEADGILVSGVRSSHGLASWFAFALDLVVGNTRLFQQQNEDILLRVSELSTKSVCVVFSFHRYAIETIHLAKLAKKQGAFVIVFTDSAFAPISEYADLTLVIQLNVKSTLDAAPIVFSLMNSIVSSLSLRNSKAFHERVKRFDELEANDIFSERKF